MHRDDDKRRGSDGRRLGCTEAKLAERWDVSTRTLQRWRREGKGPQFLRLGRRVLYPFSEIDAFEQAARAREDGAR